VIPDNNFRVSTTQSNQNYTKWIKNACSIITALELFNQVQNDLISIDEPLLIHFSVEENFEELSLDRLSSLAKIFNNNDVVIFLKSKDFNSMQIIWKSKNIDYFLCLAAPKKVSVLEFKDAYKFVVDFLIKSLVKNHIGKDN
jgi:hypothetical protein